MLEIIKYSKENKILWDEFITTARNSTFLFYRNYMDYHNYKFDDCSFIIKRNNRIVAVIPGNISENIFYSHQGLTYGGIIISNSIVLKDVIEIFDLLNNYLSGMNINEVIIKPIPYIYHAMPSQEEIYVLFKVGAEKIGCNISTTIYQNNKLHFSELRKRGIKKGRKNGVYIEECNDFKDFWTILQVNLYEKYKTNPVHNLNEISYLNSLFPDEIRLFCAKYENKTIAGAVLFIMENIVHVQYISANEIGKSFGALDVLFDELINNTFKNIPIFDFGQSTEMMGKMLNSNLIFQKEGFGGRGVTYDIYKYKI